MKNCYNEGWMRVDGERVALRPPPGAARRLLKPAAPCIMQPSAHESHHVSTFISRHPLSGPALQRIPSLEWSGQENQIAIIANKAVLILTPVSRSPTTKSSLTFQTSCINIATSDSDDTLDQSCELQQALDRLENDESMFLTKMDRMISGDTDSSSSCPFSCFLRSGKWSPCLRRNRPILSVLTSASGIQLLHQQQDKWFTLGEQQEYIRTTLKAKRKQDLVSEAKSYEQLKDQVYETSITALTWTAPDAANEFSFLITGSKSGRLFFWKAVSDDRMGGDGVVRLELRHEWNSGLGYVTRLHFFSDYLLIGTHSGQVVAVNLSSLYSPGDVSLSPVFVWEEADDLTADHFLTFNLPGGEKSFLIILPKGTFLVLIRVSGGANEVLSREQEVVVQGRNGMPVTGMCETMTEDTSSIACLISSADGLLTRVQLPVHLFGEARDACSRIVQQEVTVEGLLKSRSAIYGLTSSPFRVFTAALQTIIPYRDTLIMKEGSILLIFANVSFSHTDRWLSAQEQGAHHSPLQAIEYIIAYRSFLDKGEPYDLNFLQSDYASRDIASLKVTRHKILAIRDLLAKDASEKNQPIAARLSEALITIEQLVFRQHFLQQNTSSISSENPDQRESLKLMRSRFWNQNTCSKVGASSQRRKEQSNAASSPCPICGKALPLEGANAACPDGHVFSRCSSSLLVCDPASCRMHSCSICHSCYCTPAVWEMKYPCIFCY